MTTRNTVNEIPIGALGLNATSNVSNLSAGHLVIARNISFANGSLQKEAGAEKYNDSALASGGSAVTVRHGFDWWPDFTLQRMIVALSDGTLRRDEGGGTFSTTVKSGLSDTDDPWFVPGGLESSGRDRKLFYFNATDAVQVLAGDGTSTSDISTPPADWGASGQPSVGVIHEGRLWGAGNANDPHRLYYSTTTDHEDFQGTGAGSIPCYPGMGQRITTLVSFKGFLLVFKEPRGLYVVDTSAASDTSWRVFQSTDSVGCANPHLATHMRDGIAFLDHVANLWFLSAVDRTGNVAIEPIFPEREIAVYVRENVDFGGQAAKARMSWYPNKSELHLAVAGSGSQVNDRDIVLDLNGQTPRYRVNERDTIMALWNREESGLERPVFGTDDGFVYLMDRESREKDAAGYDAEFQTPPIDFSEFDPKLAVFDKNGMFLEVVMEPTGNWDLNVDIIWDDEVKDTITFNLGGDQAALGSFVLGDDALAGDLVLTRIERVLGSGRRLSLRGRNSGQGENFSISRMFLHYQPGGQRQPNV